MTPHLPWNSTSPAPFMAHPSFWPYSDEPDAPVETIVERLAREFLEDRGLV